MNISEKAKTEIRSYCLRHRLSNYPISKIEVVAAGSPRVKGESYHYENKRGETIRYVNAYRKAWGKPIYVPSTMRILVGKDWIKKLEKDLLQLKLSKEQGFLVHRTMVDFVFNFGDN
jgi:hypothetical protein